MKKVLLAFLLFIGYNSVFAGNYTDDANKNKRKVQNELTVYPALLNDLYRSDLYDVTVIQNQQVSPTYVYKNTKYLDDPDNKFKSLSTDANHWTSFSFSGSVTVQIKLRDGSDIKSAIVRPLSRQIRTTISNKTITFKLLSIIL